MLARLGMAAAGERGRLTSTTLRAEDVDDTIAAGQPVEQAFYRAAGRALAGETTDAARVIEEALARAAEGSAGWVLPIEPLLRVNDAPHAWQTALMRLRARAA
jgi:hypothetical protein